MLFDRFKHTATDLSPEQAERLARPDDETHVVAIQPPEPDRVSDTLTHVIRGIREFQTDLFRRNQSPTVAYEIRRRTPADLTFQFAVPTKRMERKLKNHLLGQMPVAGFSQGTTGLPVTEGMTVGGALLTTGAMDWYPLRTSFDYTPTNAIAGALYPDAMPDTRFVIQVLFRPIAGSSLRQWLWYKRAAHEQTHLRKEKEGLWRSRSATPQERSKADSIEQTVGQPLYWVSIRVVVIDGGEFTGSYCKEVTGAFNVFENVESGQYLRAEPVRPFRGKRIVAFAKAVADRAFGGWSRRFRATTAEVGALTALPARGQENITRSYT